MGRGRVLSIYDSSPPPPPADAAAVPPSPAEWEALFTLGSDGDGRALAWMGPGGGAGVNGAGPNGAGLNAAAGNSLQYLACGGDGRKVTVLEIRMPERTWETVLVVPRPSCVMALDWHPSGLLAVAGSDGTAAVVDLAYLRSGKAVLEMNYHWQRQGLTCVTEIVRRERYGAVVGDGHNCAGENGNGNSITAVRWSRGDHLRKILCLGGTDGVVECIDLTEDKKS